MKKTVSLILLTAMLLMLLPAAASAAGQEPVVYYWYDPVIKDLYPFEVFDYILIDSSVTDLKLDSGRWYVIDGEVTLQSRVENTSQVGNPANIILKNGCTLYAPYGIENGSRNSIHIYGQDKDGGNGKLIINSKTISVPDNCAGIGGGYSPGLDAQGCGYLEINGGVLEVRGGMNAAGIGGGDDAADVSVTINAGKVTAYGGEKGAGIGTGCGSTADIRGNGKIIINGGMVTAFGGDWGAGIGRGYHGYPNPVEITGGDITATGGSRGGAGIGGGKDTPGADTTITGGTVCATGNIDVDLNAIGCGIGRGASGADHCSLTITGEQFAIYSGTGETDATVTTADTYVRLREPYVRLSITETPVYTVSWRLDDGIVIDTTDVAEGEMPVHADAAKTGFIFTGWAPALAPVTGNITYTAKFVPFTSEKVAVSFDTAGGSYVETQVIDAGKKATKPAADPSREGYSFDGWYADSTYGTKFDFGTAINANTVVYAKWMKNASSQYTVTWKLDDTAIIDTTTVNAGEMPVHADTAKTGFIFTGWTPALAPVTGNITYTAKFIRLTPEKIAVSFNTAGGGYVPTQIINVGEKATKPAADPTRDGYNFAGWYADVSYGKAFDFDAPLNISTVVTAKWDKLPTPVDTKLCRIEISAAPAKTVYEPGEYFDQTGMVVTAYYSDNTSAPVSGYRITDKSPFTEEDMQVTVSYTENGITREVKQAVRVKAAPSPVELDLYGIVITTPPKKTAYSMGENFDKTGMVVNALYARPITNYSLSPLMDLQETVTDITVSYTENGVTQTALQPITVGPMKEPYKIIKGANQTILKNATSAVFASDADFDKFVRAEVDGKEVSSKYYSAKSGSTVITFNKAYISKLAKGKHTLCIVSSDGSASTTFWLSTIPVTGDRSNPMLWTALLLASVVTISLISSRTKRKNYR